MAFECLHNKKCVLSVHASFKICLKKSKNNKIDAAKHACTLFSVLTCRAWHMTLSARSRERAAHIYCFPSAHWPLVWKNSPAR